MDDCTGLRSGAWKGSGSHLIENGRRWDSPQEGRHLPKSCGKMVRISSGI